jgi:hypothetical protein
MSSTLQGCQHFHRHLWMLFPLVENNVISLAASASATPLMLVPL